MTSKPRLLISLHDVTPFHTERIRRAESLYRDLGLSKVAYLFVPEYHGGYPSAGDPAFAAFCREERPFRVQWQLHGWRHLEEKGAPASGAGDALKRALLTAGEGEFLALDPAAQRERLAKGADAFRQCLGAEPRYFVPPAWLFNSHLLPALKEIGILQTEDQRFLYRADSGKRLRSPVVTWATRTMLRKYGSLLVCPLLARIWRKEPALRVAMHPFDFDHPETVRNIRKVLASLIMDHEQAFPDEIGFS